MSKTVYLPVEPKDKELEEYLTAYFQAAGYYTERNIIEREATEVLELDSILFDYSDGLPRTVLVEIKSGGWGFPEIFKVLGWQKYLGIDSAIFITSTSKENSDIDDYYIEKSKEIGVQLAIVKVLNEAPLFLADFLRGTAVESLDIASWRYSYWIERKMMKKLIAQKKSGGDAVRFKVMAEYYHNINNVAFFIDNILDRVRDIYDQFKRFSGLTARVANEISGAGFEGTDIPRELFSKTFYECETNDLTTASYLENRSRLAILKNVVDFIIYRRDGSNSQRTRETFKILGFDVSKFSELPADTRERIDKLEQHKYLHLYPVFWQWYLWLFGGFILNDYKKDEYANLSKKTGIPIEHIDDAFGAYELLFPTGSWFSTNAHSNICCMKMFPTIFRGIGADYRKKIYTTDNEYSSLKLTGLHTRDDLIKWNNSVVAYLEPEK